MIYPRFIARFFAWLGGYFWLPCPVCKEPFAGFETDPGWGAVMVEGKDGAHFYCVCAKPSCAAEGQRQKREMMEKSGWYAPPEYGIHAEALAAIDAEWKRRNAR